MAKKNLAPQRQKMGLIMAEFYIPFIFYNFPFFLSKKNYDACRARNPKETKENMALVAFNLSHEHCVHC